MVDLNLHLRQVWAPPVCDVSFRSLRMTLRYMVPLILESAALQGARAAGLMFYVCVEPLEATSISSVNFPCLDNQLSSYLL